MDGSWTFDWSAPASDSSWLPTVGPFSHVLGSPRDFGGWGESTGVIARLSPRERPLLSVSVAEMAEPDMRLGW